MPQMPLCRNGRLTTIPHQTSLLSIDHLRLVALDPALLADCAAEARRFYPRSSLGRMG